jgi:alkanesulfonate monooxygenase SsuD/methylene tetrahydromethanopterin reductase-like flavin-dependent oxidoreductase (luciferase family)
MRLSVFLLFDRGLDPSFDAFGRALRICEAAEDLGYSMVWVAEHHFGDFGGLPNPAVFLGAAALRTQRIRLGPAVSVLPFRNPLQVAEDYAVVDRISGGRLVMGVGSGPFESEFRGFGVDRDSKRVLFEERLEVLRLLWSQEKVDFHGDEFHLQQLGLNVRPLQQPSPPMFVATNRPEAAYAAGSQGLGLLTLASFTLESLDPIEARLAEHRRGVQESGFDPDQVRNAVVLWAGAAEDAARSRADYEGPMQRFAQELGIPVEEDRSVYDVVRDRGIAALGSLEEAAEPIHRLRAMGAQEIGLWCCFSDLSTEAVLHSLQCMAPWKEL